MANFTIFLFAFVNPLYSNKHTKNKCSIFSIIISNIKTTIEIENIEKEKTQRENRKKEMFLKVMCHFIYYLQTIPIVFCSCWLADDCHYMLFDFNPPECNREYVRYYFKGTRMYKCACVRVYIQYAIESKNIVQLRRVPIFMVSLKRLFFYKYIYMDTHS